MLSQKVIVKKQLNTKLEAADDFPILPRGKREDA
jgi:hypothetical protein